MVSTEKEMKDAIRDLIAEQPVTFFNALFDIVKNRAIIESSNIWGSFIAAEYRTAASYAECLRDSIAKAEGARNKTNAVD